MTLSSIWHRIGKGVAPKKRDASFDNIVVWFHPRSLFGDLVPNVFERLSLSSWLLTPQSRTSSEHKEVAKYPCLRLLAV